MILNVIDGCICKIKHLWSLIEKSSKILKCGIKCSIFIAEREMKVQYSLNDLYISQSSTLICIIIISFKEKIYKSVQKAIFVSHEQRE